MISASVVTFKSDREELTVLLNCALHSAIDKIYMIDNSPTDELRDLATSSSKIEYCFGQGNIGYGVAHNIGIRKSIAAGATYHVVLNPDVQFAPDVIEKLANYMNENRDVGQVMPRVIYPNGELQYLCKLLPTPMDLIGRRFMPWQGYVDRSNYQFEMRASGYDQLMEVPFLSGCFMFLRVEALKKVK
ncbi:MAG: glycosyltransferase, partial [Bacteroidales bacterium]